ncbi:type IV pilus assembly protein PilM [Leifsonia shinshuensis]|uniref:type IV pilus assembly protein PilM n=1 Tax=Leifsonia shinshuensis TaxID=150026 RepID=UPI002866B782|nr:type IV pilus assembly protein PilM [Leifsonia shinshuensis]MDR6971504.1 type IV pilus assembly protein PilM [Leifsonia shinshuensis]
MVKRITGIDIGSTSIRVVEVENPGRANPSLIRHASAPIPRGAVVRGEVVEPNTVAACLRQLWSTQRFSSKRVVLGVGNQRVLVRDLSVTGAPREQIRESLPFHVQDLLPVPVSEALLDFYPIGPNPANPTEVNGLLVAAVKDAVLGTVRAVESAGLNTAEVDLIPFALSRALAPADSGGAANVVIEVGATATTVVIERGGIPQFVRIIPAGGDDLTRALGSELSLEEPEAESLKRTLGLAKTVESPDQQRVVEIIYRVTGELLTSIRNTVTFFVNTRPDQPIGRVVLSGGGAQLPGFAAALAEMTRLEVTVGDPLGRFTLTRKLSAAKLAAERSQLTIALGLVLGSAA